MRQLEPVYRDTQIEILEMPSRFKGAVLLVQLRLENNRPGYSGLFAIGKLAEQVSDKAVQAAQVFLATHDAIDESLADPLLPLCSPGDGHASHQPGDPTIVPQYRSHPPLYPGQDLNRRGTRPTWHNPDRSRLQAGQRSIFFNENNIYIEHIFCYIGSQAGGRT